MIRRALLVMTSAGAMAASACAGGTVPDGGEIRIQDPQLVEAGSALYEANCAECHGSDLRGTDQGPSHLSRVYEPGHHGDAAFWLAVLQGVRQHHWRFGDMEPVEELSQADVDAIVAFVRETQRLEGFEPYPP